MKPKCKGVIRKRKMKLKEEIVKQCFYCGADIKLKGENFCNAECADEYHREAKEE